MTNDTSIKLIENRTFDELRIGDSASLVRTLTLRDIELFAVMSGDVNPAHVDVEYAKSDMFHKVIAHGMWSGALISTVLGTQLPGPGTIYLGQSMRFHRPVGIGDTLTVTLRVTKSHVGGEFGSKVSQAKLSSRLRRSMMNIRRTVV